MKIKNCKYCNNPITNTFNRHRNSHHDCKEEARINHQLRQIEIAKKQGRYYEN